jgi:hypothetical protein
MTPMFKRREPSNAAKAVAPSTAAVCVSSASWIGHLNREARRGNRAHHAVAEDHFPLRDMHHDLAHRPFALGPGLIPGRFRQRARRHPGIPRASWSVIQRDYGRQHAQRTERACRIIA